MSFGLWQWKSVAVSNMKKGWWAAGVLTDTATLAERCGRKLCGLNDHHPPLLPRFLLSILAADTEYGPLVGFSFDTPGVDHQKRKNMLRHPTAAHFWEEWLYSKSLVLLSFIVPPTSPGADESCLIATNHVWTSQIDLRPFEEMPHITGCFVAFGPMISAWRTFHDLDEILHHEWRKVFGPIWLLSCFGLPVFLMLISHGRVGLSLIFYFIPYCCLFLKICQSRFLPFFFFPLLICFPLISALLIKPSFCAILLLKDYKD